MSDYVTRAQDVIAILNRGICTENKNKKCEKCNKCEECEHKDCEKCKHKNKYKKCKDKNKCQKCEHKDKYETCDKYMYRCNENRSKCNECKDCKKRKILLTTTQIRKFLAMANAIDNKIKVYELKDEETAKQELLNEIKNDILSMKVKLIYQSGREENVKDFVEKSKMLEEIDKIKGENTITNFKSFFNYLEALVAYRKFEGGDK